MLTEPDSGLPDDKTTTDMLAVELEAGGVSPENTEYVSYPYYSNLIAEYYNYMELNTII